MKKYSYLVGFLTIFLTACNDSSTQKSTTENIDQGELLLIYSAQMVEKHVCRQMSQLVTSVDKDDKPHNNLYGLKGKRKYINQNQYIIAEMPLQMPPNRGPFEFDLPENINCKDITMQLIVKACEYRDNPSDKKRCPDIKIQGRESFAKIELIRNDEALPSPQL